MPEERDIEKSLRAWAKRRREDAGAPVELHPATRRLLQAEVSRLKGHAPKASGPLANFLWGSRLRLVLNLSVVLVAFAVAAVLLLPRAHQQPATLAFAPAINAVTKSKAAETAVSSAAVASGNSLQREAVAAVDLPKNARAPGQFVQGINSVALADNLSLDKKIPAPPTPAASAVPSVAPPPVGQEKLAENSTLAAVSVSVNAPAAPAVIQTRFWVNSPTNAGRRDLVDAELNAVAMLSSFRTEQSGDQLRVIDADGSVYSGTVTVPTQPLDVNGYVAIRQTNSFLVSGTNLTRHQSVVFSGQLVLGDQSSLRGAKDVSGITRVGGAFGGGGGFANADTGANRALTQTNETLVPGSAAHGAAPQLGAGTAVVAGALPPQPQFRIQGRALVGTNVIQINAAPPAD
jgi:hypothetical protein